MNDDDLSLLIRNHATRHAASERLLASVKTQIALQVARAEHDAGAKTSAKVAARPRWNGFGWRAMFGGFASGVALTLMLGLVVPRLLHNNALPAELIASHVRALKAGPLIEVASSDRHTVKPWFQGKLDYAPPVIDLEADGFPLLGGRVENVRGKPTAALAYAARKHIMNVFILPSSGQSAPQVTQQDGFQVLHWNDGAMQVWVVADIEASELQRFGQAWRAKAAAR
ncbi:MAG: anti-sigma factor family protein [Burkholderiaceae bacterium]